MDASDMMLAVGALLVVVGAGWIYLPAGVIVAGLCLMACGWLWAAGGTDAARS